MHIRIRVDTQMLAILMSGHRNRKLFDLATANSQRRKLERFIRVATNELREFVESHPKYFHPETPIELKEAISRSSRIHSQSDYTDGAQALETAYLEKAQEWFLSNSKQLSNGEYFVWLGGGEGYTIDGKAEWAPVLPIIGASINAILPVLVTLLRTSGDELAIVKRDGSEAIVMDSYGGILQNEPTDREIVYELSYWKQNS